LDLFFSSISNDVSIIEELINISIQSSQWSKYAIATLSTVPFIKLSQLLDFLTKTNKKEKDISFESLEQEIKNPVDLI